MQLFIPDYAEKVINTIENNGGEAFLVGGCVRDSLLYKQPDDYDIATSLLPDKVLTLFDKTVATGIKHGTVTVIIDGKNIEVTTYRTDGSYSDSRHPESVSFVRTLNEDLARRDFTVNAFAYNKRTGLIDLFGGYEDLNNKILRTVGSPEKRFNEDALRIMRLFRFSAQLGFSVEKNSLDAALRLSHTLESISRERIAIELFKSLTSKHPEKINPLLESGALSFCGINNCKVDNELSLLPAERNIRFSAFISSANCDVKEVCSLLKTDNSLLNYCLETQQLKNIEISDTYSCKKALNRFSRKAVEDSLIMKNLSPQIVSKVIESKEPYKAEHLQINGNDLIKMGISGKEIGRILALLTDYVIENPADNVREKLIEIASNNI